MSYTFFSVCLWIMVAWAYKNLSVVEKELLSIHPKTKTRRRGKSKKLMMTLEFAFWSYKYKFKFKVFKVLYFKIASSVTFSCNDLLKLEFYGREFRWVLLVAEANKRFSSKVAAATFCNKQLNLLKIILLWRSPTQENPTKNQGDFKKVRHAKQIQSNYLYDKC